MLKIIGYLRKTFWSVVIIIILLCIQAATDLTLPEYTSKIVNTGIQAGGIESAVPELISKEDMELVLMFSDKDEKILTNYTLLGDSKNEYQKKVIKKYLDKDKQIESNTIYILNEIDEDKSKELSSILCTYYKNE